MPCEIYNNEGTSSDKLSYTVGGILMDLSNVQGIWKDVKGRCLIRVMEVSEKGISDDFYAKIEVVKGSLRGASMRFESVMPKRTRVNIYVRGHYTDDGSPIGNDWHRVTQIHASLSYIGSMDVHVYEAPVNRSRSGMTDVSVNGFWKALRGSCVIKVIGTLGEPEELTGEHDLNKFFIDVKVVSGKLDMLPRYFKGLIPTRPGRRLQVIGCATVCDNTYQVHAVLTGGWQ